MSYAIAQRLVRKKEYRRVISRMKLNLTAYTEQIVELHP